MTALKISFEFFPPKTEKSEADLWQTIKTLAAYHPEYISVTYGAGGSTQEKTFETVQHIQKTTGLATIAHLTCVGASKAEIRALARFYQDANIMRILALGGDPPANNPGFVVQPDGYKYASELVTDLKSIADFDISVAAFPEAHPLATSLAADIENLKRKQDAGAARAITQYCFETDTLLDFIDKARAAGVTMPIIPGVLLTQGVKQMVNFSNMCGASVPNWLLQRLDGLDENIPEREKIVADIAAEQCQKLLANGVEHVHFYSLNRSQPAIQVCETLGILPQ